MLKFARVPTLACSCCVKVSLEYLYHFRCDRCQQWWSRADIEPHIGEKIYCPYCGQVNEVEQVQTFRQHQFDACLKALPDPKPPNE